ncbi:MAG: nucleotidyltransferase domain-containing protein [Bacillota bacterium]
MELALDEYVAALKNRKEVIAVYLCGSWAKGAYTVASDVDLLIIIKEDFRVPRERIPQYLPSRFPVSLDLFIYTEAEIQNNPFIESLRQEGISLYRQQES